jgi:hypothetical protein
MLMRVFTLGFDPATECFDDQPVRDFLADQEVVSISDHFFVRDAVPYLALVVCYRPAASAAQTICCCSPRTSPRCIGGSPSSGRSWQRSCTWR